MSAIVEQREIVEDEVVESYQSDSDFDLTERRAPFALRCGALTIDYIIPAGIIVLGTLLTRGFYGATSVSESSYDKAGYITAAVVTFLNFFVLAPLCGQTIGKWATGLRIVKRDGQPASIISVLLRHTIGYSFSVALLFSGFLLAALTSSGRALHDYLAGTVVIQKGTVDENKEG
jgi:uncharacterized RDD family membrane protein YckC